MSLSLSNSLGFAKIPLVKMSKNSKNCFFQILQLNFHNEVGLIQHRYFELFFSVWSLFSSYKKSAPKETDFKLVRTFAVILAKYAISTSSDLFSAQNMGHIQPKTCSKYHLVSLLAPQSGALRITPLRDFHPIPIPSHTHPIHL